jgi:hypothetical protein
MAQGDSGGTQPLFAPSDKPPIELPNLISGGFDTPQEIFSFVVTTLALVAGIAAFFMLLYGGYKYITSGGDPAAADQGRKIIIGSIIGIVIVALSSVLVQFIIQIKRGAL